MDNKQLEEMLKIAAKKLGTTADQLKEMAINGNLEQKLNQTIDAPTQKLKETLNNPETAKKLLSTPEAQELMKWLNKKDSSQ